jgi:hypothetical protein
MNKIILPILAIFAAISPVFAQNNKPDTSKLPIISVNFHYGFVIDHGNAVSYVVKHHVPAMNVRISKKTNQKGNWQELYNYPEIGLGYYQGNLGNPDVLGKANAVFSFISFPFIKQPSFEENFTLGLGLAYLNKKFDYRTNYYNIVIGSHFNIYCNLAFNSKIRISKNLNLLAGLDFQHFSNGATNMPNKGLNILSLNTGFSFGTNIPKLNTAPKARNFPEVFEKRKEYSIFGALGFKEIYPPAQKKYIATTLAANWELVYSRKHKVGVGFDFFYDPSINGEYKKRRENEVSDANNYGSGVHVSYDFIFDKLSFTVQQGVYLYSKKLEDKYIYQRYGFRYKLNKHYFANLTLKTYVFTAECIEWGIGYCWN